jgi:hypothetical protein
MSRGSPGADGMAVGTAVGASDGWLRLHPPTAIRARSISSDGLRDWTIGIRTPLDIQNARTLDR